MTSSSRTVRTRLWVALAQTLAVACTAVLWLAPNPWGGSIAVDVETLGLAPALLVGSFVVGLRAAAQHRTSGLTGPAFLLVRSVQAVTTVVMLVVLALSIVGGVVYFTLPDDT